MNICHNFPETLEKAFIINPDKNFYNIFWSALESKIFSKLKKICIVLAKNFIPKAFKEKLLFFSQSPDKKIPGFACPLLPLVELSKFIDPSILPLNYGGTAKYFSNFLNGINKKPSNADNFFEFNNLLSELQSLEFEKKKKVKFFYIFCKFFCSKT